jgi:hypothetical protein
MMTMHPEMMMQLPPTNDHKKIFLGLDGLKRRIRRANTPSLGTTNDRIPGANAAALYRAAVSN